MEASTDTPAIAPPSDWIVRWTPLLPPGAQVLDVACGHGRHAHWLARAGHRVTAIDREAALLAPLSGLAETLQADLEAAPWPLPGRRFDAVVVTNYLWRPLFPALKDAVAPGGLLIYETFAQAHAALGRPRRPEFLLRPGELVDVLRAPEPGAARPPSPSETWHVIAFEQGRLPARGASPEREVQRIVARRGGATSARVDLLASPG
ncbi:MAG TPA: class I SAM-dependent methyltransferase [Burkholderiaceae bacterium]|nr:class I SAM-dependent methyltransferase [Burkholderiaceae bacterium]